MLDRDRHADMLAQLDADALKVLVRSAADPELAFAAFRRLRKLDGLSWSAGPTNAQRASRGEATLAEYIALRSGEPGSLDADAADLISDVLHYMQLLHDDPDIWAMPSRLAAGSRPGATPASLPHRYEPFRIAERALTNFASERVQEDATGPDLIAEVQINGLDPRYAVQKALSPNEDEL